jgi:hypothetical protein
VDGEDWASVKKNRGVGEDCGRKMIVAGCVAGMTDFLLTFDLSGVEFLGKEMAMEKITCDICPCEPVVSGVDAMGTSYYACVDHASCLAGWIREANSEMNSDCLAALRFEDAAYGDD